MELTSYGVWIGARVADAERGGEAAALAEELGFGALWLGGSPKLPAVRPLLAATTRLVVATGIVNVWANEPATLAAEYAELEREFPGRLLIGIGIGHPEATSEYANPLATMRGFLDGLDGAPTPVPKTRRCLAALGPRMLDLSAERSLGSHTYFVPVAHTRAARERLGAAPLLAAELACALDHDPGRAREAARTYATYYLARRNYTSNLARHGYAPQELVGGGSDRLLDELVPQGSAAKVAAVARAHLEAGANHVCLQPVGIGEVPRAEWTALAAELIG